MSTENEPLIKELTDQHREQKVRDFKELLSRIDNADDKHKQLWLEIYENAITDRQNAFVMFAKLARIAGQEHRARRPRQDDGNVHRAHVEGQRPAAEASRTDLSV